MSMTTLGLNPRLSIIIPTRNRISSLKKVLHALERQDCSKYSFEVIVIDDGSDDGTIDFLEKYAVETSLNFRFIRSEGISAGDARNRGVFSAKGEYVLFLDADTIPARDVIKKHLQLQNTYADVNGCIIGRVSMSPDLAVTHQARLWETEFHFPKNSIHEVEWCVFRTANTSLKRSMYLKCGGFNPHLVAAEDTEIAYRLAGLGVRFFYDHSVMVIHHHPMTIWDFMKKGTLYGKAVARWYRETPELRAVLASRYGVYSFEMSMAKKLKYVLRAFFVNRVTIPFIVLTGSSIRNYWFEFSDKLYWCAYKYRIRRAFRECLSLLS